MNKLLQSLFETRRRRRRPAHQCLTRAAVTLGLCVSFAASLCADSLWQDGQSKALCADKRACQVGDIVTILVQENSSATKDNTTKTSKDSSIDAAISSFLYSPAASSLLTQKGALPALSVSGKSEFAGGGQINNSQQIAASVAVRVVDVLPNNNLVIEGTRESSFSGEQQTIILRGTIRLDDISANNTVNSANVADATIKFVSKGPITDSQRKGWFQRLWDKFSPF
jgi:flagellar L-ring protein precursor FlgH